MQRSGNNYYTLSPHEAELKNKYQGKIVVMPLWLSDHPGRSFFKGERQDFPGGAVVKNPPVNAGDTGSSPGPGSSHMPRSN